MRYAPINSQLFTENRASLHRLMLPNALAVVNANDILPTNADGTLLLKPNADLFYLSGIEQEESILLIYPDAHEEKMREILFLRESNESMEIWEGHKLTKKEARELSGIERVEWLSEFPGLFHRLMCECEHVYLNSNEHKRATVVVETRDARFVKDCQARYPLHQYHRLARLLHRLRVVKSDVEIELIRRACAMTEKGFRRAAKLIKPGVKEMEIEAEFGHEFVRQGGGFAYSPIIATGRNACVLHYVANNQTCRKGELVLIDVAASYANYHSDLTRTLPVTGRFTRRQRQVYNAVLRIFRQSCKLALPGKLPKDWQKEGEALVEKELVDLGLLKITEIKKQDPDNPAFKKYFMHGVGHPLGLDVHDVGLTTEPIQPGWVLTCEPAIYVQEEGFAVRLENDILVTDNGYVDLMGSIPIEADEIEELMK
ncbi:MAG TPA: Xaa-Pro aminopeptidase [Verrucomicrobiae bacterium]|nr:Xaa-Pro aminopeptidase [Verrucomicrobiae bacterium]